MNQYDENTKSFFLELIEKNLKIGFWEINIQTQKLFWSKVTHDIHETDYLTYAPDLNQGINFYHEDDKKKIEKLVSDLIQNGTSYTAELRLKTFKNNIVWVRVSGNCLVEDNIVTKVYGTIENIQESYQKKLTQELILDAVGIGHFSWNLQTNQVNYDSRWKKIIGYNDDELANNFDTWNLLVHEEDRARCHESIQKLIESKTLIYDEKFRLKTKEQKWKWIHAKAIITQKDENNKPLLFSGIHIDIDEMILNQQKMIENSKFASLGEMAASMAHEINNPLAVIYGHVSRLQKMAEEKINHDILMKSLSKISSNSERIAKIIRSLRTFSRKPELSELIELNTKQIIEEALDMCSEKIHHQSVKIITSNLPESCSVSVIASQILQVFVNLLNNAIDAISEQSDPWIKISSEESTENFKIYFIDSGNGIPQNLQDSIMQPFFSTKEEGKGTGLGLSISKTILEKFNAELYIDSSHINTCFVIEFKKGQ